MSDLKLTAEETAWVKRFVAENRAGCDCAEARAVANIEAHNAARLAPPAAPVAAEVARLQAATAHATVRRALEKLESFFFNCGYVKESEQRTDIRAALAALDGAASGDSAAKAESEVKP